MYLHQDPRAISQHDERTHQLAHAKTTPRINTRTNSRSKQGCDGMGENHIRSCVLILRHKCRYGDDAFLCGRFRVVYGRFWSSGRSLPVSRRRYRQRLDPRNDRLHVSACVHVKSIQKSCGAAPKSGINFFPPKGPDATHVSCRVSCAVGRGGRQEISRGYVVSSIRSGSGSHAPPRSLLFPPAQQHLQSASGKTTWTSNATTTPCGPSVSFP